MEWTNSSVMVNLPILEISKIISIGNLACRPNIKKNNVSCIIELKEGRVVRWLYEW